MPKPAPRPTKRQIWMAMARNAGYHNDSRTIVRVIVENGGLVSRRTINEQWAIGARLKREGLPCLCPDCKAAANA